MSIDWKALVAEAQAVRENAYAPYSGYRVGAALVTTSGHVYRGCNFENASYGLTLCAERTAMAQMIAEGEREIAAIAIVTEGPEAGTPCGLCRQTMAELARDLPIALAIAGADAPSRITSLAELFPQPFRGDLVKR